MKCRLAVGEISGHTRYVLNNTYCCYVRRVTRIIRVGGMFTYTPISFPPTDERTDQKVMSMLATQIEDKFFTDIISTYILYPLFNLIEV